MLNAAKRSFIEGFYLLYKHRTNIIKYTDKEIYSGSKLSRHQQHQKGCAYWASFW
jgi:hypothetical protein